MKKILVALLFLVTISGLSLDLKGTVSDETGNPVANSPVFFVMKRVLFNIRTFKFQEVESKTVSTKTDAHGLYSLAVDIDPYFNHFYLYFHGDGFDFAQFLRPEPEDVTNSVKAGKEIIVNRVLKTNPLWNDLQIVLSELDKKSEKYKILRQYGFPENREKLSNGKEKWYYFELGKEFTLDSKTTGSED